jgi:hypothetical protein
MKTIFLIIGLSIGIFSCDNDDNFDNSLNGSWTVFSFEDLTTGTTEFKTQDNSWNKDIKIQINDIGNPKTISGMNITNQIFGEFSYTAPNQFRVSEYFASTKVNQPRWADEFVIAILDPNLSFEVARDRLKILYDNNTKSVTLTRD